MAAQRETRLLAALGVAVLRKNVSPRVLDGRGLATAVTWGFSKASPCNVGARRSTGLWSRGRVTPQQLLVLPDCQSLSQV